MQSFGIVPLESTTLQIPCCRFFEGDGLQPVRLPCKELPALAAEGKARRSSTFPQGLKPIPITTLDVRAKARTLHLDVDKKCCHSERAQASKDLRLLFPLNLWQRSQRCKRLLKQQACLCFLLLQTLNHGCRSLGYKPFIA